MILQLAPFQKDFTEYSRRNPPKDGPIGGQIQAQPYFLNLSIPISKNSTAYTVCKQTFLTTSCDAV